MVEGRHTSSVPAAAPPRQALLGWGTLSRESPSSRRCARGARLYLNPSVQGPRSHDAIGSVHRAWDERRMWFRSFAHVAQLTKGAAASSARISSQRTQIGR